MDSSIIRKYAGLMEELGLTGLEVKENDTTVKLERNACVSGKTENAAEKPESASLAPVDEDRPASDESIVISPMVGVFHEAPDESGAPFVQEGDHVEKGDVLCIIEAMKLMNEITAEEAGTIAKVCAENGQVVDYGTELFRIKR